jgi:hypothetical protein
MVDNLVALQFDLTVAMWQESRVYNSFPEFSGAATYFCLLEKVKGLVIALVLSKAQVA